MKILNVALTTRKGGLEQVFLDYKNILKENNVSVTSIIHRNSKILLEKTDNFYQIANFSKFDPFALFKLGKIVKYEKPDLILTHGNRAHYLMKKIAGKVRVIGLSHVYSFDYIMKCDYIIAISQDMKKAILELGYDEKRIFHIPNMLHPPEKIKYKKRDENSIPVIGVLARLDHIKGVDIFVRAISILKSQNIMVKGLIGGDGPEYNNIKKLISELSLEKEISMIGWVEDKEEFYNNIDIFCLPSLKETFGLVILESFLYAKPVIISALPGPLEIVRNEENGLVFNVNDPEDLALAIKKLMSDKILANKLISQGISDIKSYSQNSIGSKIIEIFSKILQEGEQIP